MTKLKKMRESRGLTQSQLAKKSGVSVRALQYYEQGKLNFNGAKVSKIFSIALALGCDVEDILSDENTVRIIREYQEQDV